jgi:hypothetical protein
MPKPTATGRPEALRMRSTAGSDGVGVGLLHAGHPGDRDVIDEARGAADHGRQALVVRRRRGQADQSQAFSLERIRQRIGFFRRAVDDDQTIDASVVGLLGEGLIAAVTRAGSGSPSG